MLIEIFLVTKFISVALGNHSIKGVSKTIRRLSLENQVRRAGCLGLPVEGERVAVAGK